MSAGPHWKKKIGEKAYRRCTLYRFLVLFFQIVSFANYVIYFFYPLPIGLPIAFPWDWWISVVFAVLIAAPAGYVMYLGMRDAGDESFFVKKEHTMFGGIYEKIRHPQAAGEVTL